MSLFEKTSKSISQLGTRKNPFPIGMPGVYNAMEGRVGYSIELTVLEVIRGDKAAEIIAKADPKTSKAPDGMEYILVKFHAKALDSKDDQPIGVASYRFSFISEQGVIYKPIQFIYNLDAEFEYLYVGGEEDGYVFNLIKSGDNPIIVYLGGTFERIYFSTKPSNSTDQKTQQPEEMSIKNRELTPLSSNENKVSPSVLEHQQDQWEAEEHFNLVSLVAEMLVNGGSIMSPFKKTSKSISQLGTHKNPFPIGTPGVYNAMEGYVGHSIELTVLEVIRGDKAAEMIAKADPKTPKAPDGMEYILVKFHAKALDSKDDQPIHVASYRFNFISEQGVTYKNIRLFYNVQFRDLYVGAEVDGYVFNLIKSGDNPIVVYLQGTSARVYFSTKPSDITEQKTQQLDEMSIKHKEQPPLNSNKTPPSVLELQLDQWEAEGHFQFIAEMLENIPDYLLDYSLTLKLALAYNNTGRSMDAIRVLNKVSTVGEFDALWNYYIGYALLFSGEKREARKRLLRSREIEPTGNTAVEEILYQCICYDVDEDNEIVIDGNKLKEWLCDLIGNDTVVNAGPLSSNRIKINTRLGPLVEKNETKMNAYSSTICFDIDLGLGNGYDINETSTGISKSILDSFCNAFGSFYLGIFKAIRNMLLDNRFAEIRDNDHRVWDVYKSELTGMTLLGSPLHVETDYWKLIGQIIPDYIGKHSFVYIKIYAQKFGDSITVECRINDMISYSINEIVRQFVSTWGNVFATQKQFFILTSREWTGNYPYTQAEMNCYVKSTVELFCEPEITYRQMAETVFEQTKDVDLTYELCRFIPEICAASTKNYENIKFHDVVVIDSGVEKKEYNKWQITSYLMINKALVYGFKHGSFPKDFLGYCVGFSDTYDIVSKAESKDVDLDSLAVSLCLSFPEDYTVR